ncbi:MAG: MFS transporter [Methanomassiliicoccales archaeon]|nr:MAG: MFS transporter [Methanomassiliicoccales archaeon]
MAIGLNAHLSKRTAFSFIIVMGIVSLLVDLVYEGARSITGPYLSMLGASAAVVGFVAGFGELAGYGLRYVSGVLSDRTKQYWLITIAGYSMSVIAVPLLALAGSWELAAVLIVTERAGKAIRTPAKDTMLSHATSVVGHGRGFGIHEAMDQTGALIGPMIIAVVLFLGGSYQAGFALMVIPAIMALVVLLYARHYYPNPRGFEGSREIRTEGIPRSFWFYLMAVALVAAAFADFALMSFHFEKTGLVDMVYIPIFYAVAMGVDAIAALAFGRLYDKIGLPVLAMVSMISAFFAPLVFLGDIYMALIGTVLWGVGMGAQESVMRAAVAELVPPDKRSTGYGIFNLGYGVFWFIGSAIMGVLYDVSIVALVAFSFALQVASVPIFLRLKRSK